mmetsp:Transcript_25653/g.59294  ORF Transcript_25653/g.59294 Transcript_25653/m.59294 type:complete len:691 (-) Transcript_25653:139-2211(-)
MAPEATAETGIKWPKTRNEELAAEAPKGDAFEDDGSRDYRSPQLVVQCREVRAHPADPRLAIAVVRDIDAEALSFVPEGSQASLSCSPGILFHVQEIQEPDPVEDAVDGECSATESGIVLCAVDPGWRGLEGAVDGVAITAIFAGSDLEEALFASRNHLLGAEDQQVDKDKLAEVLWDADELLACAAELFPEVAGDMLSSDLEAELGDSSLLDVASSEAEGKILICFKHVLSPLEDTALREMYHGGDKKYKKPGRERPWQVIADALQEMLGTRNGDLDRRILSESPELLISRSEALHEFMVELRFPEREDGSQEHPHEPKNLVAAQEQVVVAQEKGKTVHLTAARDRARSHKAAKEHKEGSSKSPREREHADRSKANGRESGRHESTRDSHRSREPRYENSQRRRDAERLPRRQSQQEDRKRLQDSRRSDPKEQNKERRSRSAHGHKDSRRKEEVVLRPREGSRPTTHSRRDHDRQRKEEDRHRERGRDGHTRVDEKPRERIKSASLRDGRGSGKSNSVLDTKRLEERLRALQRKPQEGRSRSRRGVHQDSSKGQREQTQTTAKLPDRRDHEDSRRVDPFPDNEKSKTMRLGRGAEYGSKPQSGAPQATESQRLPMPLPSQAPKVQPTRAPQSSPCAAARTPVPSSRPPQTALPFPLAAALAGPRPPSTPPPGYRGPRVPRQPSSRAHGQ